MKLYYSPGACSTATHITLEWIGKPYELHKVEIHPQHSPELIEANPQGKVPVFFDDDGSVLTQNSAILNYLAETNPQAKLLGNGTAKSHAEVNRWLGMVNSDMHPRYWPLFGGADFLGDPKMIEKAKDNTKAVLRKQFEIVNQQLKGRDWIAGTRSIADPYLFVMIRWAKMQKINLTGLNEVERFFKHMERDPGVRKALDQESKG